MTYTIATNSFWTTDYENTKLINVPTHFTAAEAKFLEIFLQSIQTNMPSSLSKKLVIDFGQTIFIDSKGLIGLCKILRLAQTKKIDMSILSFSPQVKIVADIYHNNTLNMR